MDKLAKMPTAVHEEVTRAGADETVKAMRVYPAEKSISRTQAYGTPFFTDKQRRYFFWALRKGIITVPYRRTNNLRDNWVIIGQGLNEMVVNETPYAGLVMGDNEQSRMSRQIGWKTLAQRLRENEQKLAKVLKSAADKALRKLGLK
jgi:hypothetical protein